MATIGWMGILSHVLWYLHTVNADQDDEGNYLVSGPEGSGVHSFMGMKGEGVDVVVPGDMVYFKGGNPVNLAAGMNETSYGVRGITVI